MRARDEGPMLDRAYRFTGRANRPAGVRLPPEPMPIVRGGTLLKRWRFVGIWTREVCLGAGRVKVGPVPQQFWSVWDRAQKRWLERTRFIGRNVQLPPCRLIVHDGEVHVEVELLENEGFEVVTPHERAYIWTRKQVIPARGVIHIGGREHQVDGRAFIDENAGYHARRMTWRWSAGVGADTGGRRIAWNAVVGYNDTPPNSENTVWVDDVAQEIGAVRFADDLSSVAFSEGGSIHFHQEAMRARRDDLLLIRSDYAQPIGTFTGTLPFGIRLREAYGVMERHEALW